MAEKAAEFKVKRGEIYQGNLSDGRRSIINFMKNLSIKFLFIRVFIYGFSISAKAQKIVVVILILLSSTFAFGQVAIDNAETCEQAFKAKHYEYAVGKCTDEIELTELALVTAEAIGTAADRQKHKEKLFTLYFARGYSNMFAPRAYGKGEKEKFFARSVIDFQECVKIAPNEPMPFYLLGFAQSTALKPEEQITAAKNFSEAIRLNSTQKDIYYLRGKAYENYYSTIKTTAERNKGYELAIADYTKSLELKQMKFESLTARKDLYIKMERYKEAIDELNLCIKEFDFTFFYRVELGETYLKWKKYTESIKQFTELLEGGDEELESSREEILGFRADAYKSLGKKTEWCKDKKAIDEDFDCDKEWKKK